MKKVLKANNLKEFKNNFNRHDFQVIFAGDKDFIMLSYVMDMVIALVLIMVSVFLIIISKIINMYLDYHHN